MICIQNARSFFSLCKPHKLSTFLWIMCITSCITLFSSFFPSPMLISFHVLFSRPDFFVRNLCTLLFSFSSSLSAPYQSSSFVSFSPLLYITLFLLYITWLLLYITSYITHYYFSSYNYVVKISEIHAQNLLKF